MENVPWRLLPNESSPYQNQATQAFSQQGAKEYGEKEKHC